MSPIELVSPILHFGTINRGFITFVIGSGWGASTFDIGFRTTPESTRVHILTCFMKKNIVLILIASCLYFSAEATSRLVPGNYSSVQDALNVSKAGDTVLVDDGVFTGNIIWPNYNGIVLKSLHGKEASFLDGNAAGSVITINGTPNTVATIDGFTIQNGFVRATSSNGYVAGGAAVNAVNTVLIVKNCNITENRLTGDIEHFSYCTGAGINADASKLNISNCNFSENTVDSTYNVFGGVIYASNSQSSLSGLTFQENGITAFASIQGGILAQSTGKANIKNSSFTQNRVTVTDAGSVSGGTCYFSDLGSGSFTNVLIGDNTISSAFTVQGGSIWSSFSLSLIHCTLAGNHFTTGTGIGGNAISLNNNIAGTPKLKVTNSIMWSPEGSPFEMAFVGSPSVTYSDVYGGFSGAGNFALDPLFVSSSDFHLQNSSPCLNTSSAAANPPLDLEGNNRPMPVGTKADLGALETNQPLKTMDVVTDAGVMSGMDVYPNPVHASANIEFELADANDVVIDIIDLSGRNVKHILASNLEAGVYSISFNAEQLAPGAYFIKTQIGDKTLDQKITVD